MRPAVAPLRHPAHLHGRHAPLRRQGGHGVRSQGQGDHGSRRARVRRDHGRRRRRAAPPGRHPQPRLRPRRLPPHRRPGRAPRQDHRGPAPRPGRSTWSCPSTWCSTRLAARRVCTDCATNYSVDSPPRYGWVCDNCGGDVVQRADDTPEAIQKRLDLYERETTPLIAWYEEHDLLAGGRRLGSADEVTARLVAAIDERTPHLTRRSLA